MTNDEARALIAEAKDDAAMLEAFREFGDSYLIRTKHGAYGTHAVAKAIERELALADGYAEALAEVAKLKDIALAAGVVRNMRFAVDSRLTPEERRVFDPLSKAWDAWKWPESKP